MSPHPSAPSSAARLAKVAPGLASLVAYERRSLRHDLVAGAVLAAILVPQGMAYAELAGLPAVTGLYTTVFCLVGYAIMGPSRVLVLGPDSSLGPLILAAIVPLVGAGGDPDRAIALAGMMAILVGLIEIGLGTAKLGFVADLLSKEVQVGYMNGLAITIIVGQLPKLCGFSTQADGFVDRIRRFVTDFDRHDTTAMALGISLVAVLVLLPRLTKRIPAVLVVVIGATVLVGAFDLHVPTVGSLPRGLPRPVLPWTGVDDVLPLLVAAFGITLVSLTDTIATSTSFAARRGDEVDPDQEMIGLGAANVVAGLFRGFAVSTSSSRTAVAEQSGARTQLTGLVGASLVTIMLLRFDSLLQHLPQTALAAVVIAAAISLADLPALVRFAKVRASALLLALTALAGVVFLGVLEGIVVAIVLSVLLFFHRSWWPKGEVLGFDAPTGLWHSLSSLPDGEQIERVVVYRWEAPLFFANAGMFRQQVRRVVRESSPTWVVLQCEAITDIDITAADVLLRLHDELAEMGVHLVFAELRSRLMELIERYGLLDTIAVERFHRSIDLAITDVRLRLSE